MNLEELKQSADRNGLDITADSIKLNESGLDFQVAFAEDKNGERWVLRIPRRPASMRHAKQEKAVLDIISRHARFEVPNWAIFTEELIAYKQLNGVPAATIDMEKQAYVWSIDETNVPNAFHESLGAALADLHAIPKETFKDAGMEMLAAAELRYSMKQRMDRVKDNYAVHPRLRERWQAWLADESLWPAHTGVRHGDMHPGHILIDRNSRVTGFIDWTEAEIGDVSVDFLTHHLLFGEEGLKKLLDAYARAGGKTWKGMIDHIIELQAASGITVAEYAQVSGLKDMHEAAVHMLAGES